MLSSTQNLLDLVVKNFPKLKVMIEGLSYLPSTRSQIPPLQRPRIISCEIVKWEQLDDDNIKAFLLAATHLERLYLSGGNGAWIPAGVIMEGPRLPAL